MREVVGRGRITGTGMNRENEKFFRRTRIMLESISAKLRTMAVLLLENEEDRDDCGDEPRIKRAEDGCDCVIDDRIEPMIKSINAKLGTIERIMSDSHTEMQEEYGS